jgi:hypothetical protein
VLDLESAWFFVAPFRLLRAAAQYSRFAFLSGEVISEQFRALRHFGGRMLWLVMFPLGALLFWRDRSRFSMA